MSSDKPIVLAAIIGAHGLQGEVRLKLFTEDLSAYKPLSGGGRNFTLKSIRPGSNGAVARFAEIGDRNTAEALRGTELSIPRAAMPPLAEGEYYHIDLIGLPCLVGDETIGTAAMIEDFGAGDVLEIEKPDGKRFMVPVAKAVTVEPDRLLIDPEFVE
jgi:16S rRNA processing protein RimM